MIPMLCSLAGCLTILWAFDDHVWKDALGLVVAVGLGAWVCVHVGRLLQATDQRRIRMVFLCKLPVLLLVLFLGWTPHLSPTSSLWGYDPQRYYDDALRFAQSGFDMEALPAINYTGVLFYYGAQFVIFGEGPVLPALVNALTTLMAALFMVRLAYRLAPDASERAWQLCFIMMLPEVLWFDTIPRGGYMVRRPSGCWCVVLSDQVVRP